MSGISERLGRIFSWAGNGYIFVHFGRHTRIAFLRVNKHVLDLGLSKRMLCGNHWLLSGIFLKWGKKGIWIFSILKAAISRHLISLFPHDCDVGSASENEGKKTIIVQMWTWIFWRSSGNRKLYEISSQRRLDLYSIQWKQKKKIILHLLAMSPEIFWAGRQTFGLLITDIDGCKWLRGNIMIIDEGGSIRKYQVKAGWLYIIYVEIGCMVGAITGRESPVVVNRCEELKFWFSYPLASKTGLRKFQKLLESGEAWKPRSSFNIGDESDWFADL